MLLTCTNSTVVSFLAAVLPQCSLHFQQCLRHSLCSSLCSLSLSFVSSILPTQTVDRGFLETNERVYVPRGALEHSGFLLLGSSASFPCTLTSVLTDMWGRHSVDCVRRRFVPRLEERLSISGFLLLGSSASSFAPLASVLTALWGRHSGDCVCRRFVPLR